MSSSVRNIIFRLFYLLLVSITACTSPLSDTPVTDTSQLAVTIHVQTRETNDGYGYSEMEAVLTDAGGKPINNPSIRIKVNGTEMPLFVNQDLYYGKHPSYRLTDGGEEGVVAENTLYTFTVVLSDSSEHRVGSLMTPGRLLPEQFNFPDSISRNKNFILQWKQVPVAAEVLVYRMIETTDSTGTQVLSGGPYDTEALSRKLGSKSSYGNSGKWSIPATYLRIPDGRVTDLGFQVKATKDGEIKGKFLPASSISYTSTLERYIPLTAQ